MAKDTQILVNGKAMTNQQYLDILKQAKEATEAYKKTPAYQAEVEHRKQMSEKRNEFIGKFIEFGKKLGLTEDEIGSIGDKLYQMKRNRNKSE